MMYRLALLAVVISVTARTSQGAIFTPVSVTRYAGAGAVSLRWDGTSFVPLFPGAAVTTSADGTVDSGHGTTASVLADINPAGDTINASITSTGVHGGGATYTGGDMYNYYDDFYATANFELVFNVATSVNCRITANQVNPFSQNTYITGPFSTLFLPNQTLDVTLPAGQYTLQGSIGFDGANGSQSGFVRPDSLSSVQIVSPVPVPEPGSLSLLIIGAFVGLGIRRRDRKWSLA